MELYVFVAPSPCTKYPPRCSLARCVYMLFAQDGGTFTPFSRRTQFLYNCAVSEDIMRSSLSYYLFTKNI